jgi:hypothetical protein
MPAMTEQHTPSPRSRLQALLAIPDNQRTEEQWDELHELEITLAPGNRIGHQDKPNPPAGQNKGGGRGGNPRSGGHKTENRGGENRGASGGRANQPPRPPRPNPPRPANVAPTEGGQEAPVGDGAGGESAAAATGEAGAKKPFRRFHKRPPKPAPASE